MEAVKKMAFSLLTLPEQQQVEECVITITRQKPETLFSFIKQIGHMLGMVFTLVLPSDVCVLLRYSERDRWKP